MSGLRSYASPLAGTVLVLAGLSLLAVPLHRLTSGNAKTVEAVPPAADARTEIPAVLRLKLLDPVAKLTVAETEGTVLLDAGPLPAGESEHDAVIPFDGGLAELNLRVEAGGEETAVFLTVMPDGHEDRTLWLTGSGMLEETLRYEWQGHGSE